MAKIIGRGKLIVFEGIDGAGTGTQSNLFFDYFKKLKTPVQKLVYPDKNGPIASLIYDYLHKKYNFDAETQFLLYFADFVKDIKKIKELLKEGKIVIADRYFTSTMAYQGLQGFPIEKSLDIAKIFDLPKPDLIIYLKVSPEISIKRKLKEKKHLDRNEKDRDFQKRVALMYEKLIKNQVFGKWVVVDGEKSIEEVFKEIRAVINRL